MQISDRTSPAQTLIFILMSSLVLAQVSGCTAPPEPVCRLSGESCGPTEGCCEGLNCSGGTCQQLIQSGPDDGGSGGGADAGGPSCGNRVCDGDETAATCCQDCPCPSGYSCNANRCVSTGPKCGNGACELGETQTSCCTDCGCPTGQTCAGGICQTPIEVCGNGICRAGETSSSCCADCGCPSGLACERAKCRIPGTSDLTWTVISNVYSQDIDYKFFDENRNLVWPGATTHWTISGGGSVSWTLACYTGDNICFGGNGHTISTRYWGVGLNRDQSCTNCCRTCTDGSTSITLLP